MNLRFP